MAINMNKVCINNFERARDELKNKFNTSTSKYKRFLPVGLALSALWAAGMVSGIAQGYFKGMAHLILAPWSKTKNYNFKTGARILSEVVIVSGALVISPIHLPILTILTQIQLLKNRKI